MEPPVTLTPTEELLEQRDRDLDATEQRANDLAPHITELRAARQRIEGGLVEQIQETPPTRWWSLLSYCLCLKASQLYADHFEQVIESGETAKQERAKIRSGNEWARIKAWRSQRSSDTAS